MSTFFSTRRLQEYNVASNFIGSDLMPGTPHSMGGIDLEKKLLNAVERCPSQMSLIYADGPT